MVDRHRLDISSSRYETDSATHSADQHKPHEQQHPTDGDFDAWSLPPLTTDGQLITSDRRCVSLHM